MKKLFFCCLLSVALNGTAVANGYTVDNGNIVVEEIIENTGLDVEACHACIVSYFATAFNNSNRTMRLNEPNHLIYKGIFSDLATFNIYWDISAEFTLDVSIKDNRVRVRIYSREAKASCPQSPHDIVYRFVDAPPMSKNFGGAIVHVTRKAAEKAFDALINRMCDVVVGIKGAIAVKPVSENW